MAATKYDDLVKTVPFENYEKGCIRQAAVMGKKFLGFDVHIKYGACWNAGRLDTEPYQPHVHDYDSVMLFLGSDTNNLGDLCGEVQLCLGEEQETYITTSSVAVYIPKGFQHYHGTINAMNKRIIFMEVSVAAEYKETLVPTNKKPTEPLGWKSKYKKHIVPLAFAHKGAWHYGPENRDDGGGDIAFINGKDFGIETVILYESMKKAPYRLCPDPDSPHAHATTQCMFFMGTDTDDLNNLGAEFEICLGKEEERHVFTQPSVVLTPPFLPHWPGGLLKIDKPVLMCDVHPFGNAH
jgi:hypothetical protein